ncbi:aminodeoxychorismate/anthranilate synthase component II [Colwelliaceae bacterium 6471]
MNKNTTKIFILDNLDSFTYNLVDEFQSLGYDPIIYRNTLSADFIFQQIAACESEVLLVLSPGPGAPSDAGCLMTLIAKSAGKLPILGICLGHQALVQHYGGTVERAPEIVHGKSSNIVHNGDGSFFNINNPLPVARYHSLVATKIPEDMIMTAHCTSQNDEVLAMAVAHETDAILGFQFHPESILTTYGSTLLAQSIQHLITLQAQQHKQGKQQVNLTGGDINE